MWPLRHKAQMWPCNWFRAFFHACECWQKCWKLKADFCMEVGCRRMGLSEGTYNHSNQIQTLNVSSPSYFTLFLLWHPFLFNCQNNPRNWCLLLFLKPKFSFEKIFSERAMKTNAIFKSFSCNQLLASDLSCLFFWGKALCPPSALHRLYSTWPGCTLCPLCAGIHLSIGCLEPLMLNCGKEYKWFERCFRREAIMPGPLKEVWFMWPRLIREWGK